MKRREREVLKTPLVIAAAIMAALSNFEAAFILAGVAHVVSLKVAY